MVCSSAWRNRWLLHAVDHFGFEHLPFPGEESHAGIAGVAVGERLGLLLGGCQLHNAGAAVDALIFLNRKAGFEEKLAALNAEGTQDVDGLLKIHWRTLTLSLITPSVNPIAWQ